MAKRLSRIERDIERLKEKISEYQQQLKELEAAKTEQENLQIIQLVRSMNMKPDEFAAFLRSGALKIHRSCKDAIREFGLYRWDEKSTEDRPIKENDHAMDDTRYFAMTVLRRRVRDDNGEKYIPLWER